MKQLARTEIAHSNVGKIDERFNVLNRWTFIMMQIFESKSFLDLAETTHAVHPSSSMDELLTQQALFKGFLLAYGKCFASSGASRSSLDSKKVFEGREEILAIHEQIMNLRHKFAAHNDTSGLDEAVIYVEEQDDGFVLTKRYAMANPLNEYESYRKVINILEEYVVVKTNKALDSLRKKLGKTITVRNG